jgi:nucleoside phosphorylase
MSRHYFLRNIRALLTEGFTDEELRRLCYDVPDFRPVYDQLARDTGKAGIIDRLLEHAEQKVLLETLLHLAQTLSPARYEQHQPYYGLSVTPATSSNVPGKAQAFPVSPSIAADVLPIDFIIITALEDERNALLDKLPGYQRLKPSDEDIRVYFRSNLPVIFADGSTGAYRIVIMPLLGMGRVQATIATSDAIHRWQPRYVMLVGIAGGVAAKGVKLGDILVADQIVDYELQKLTSKGAQIRWRVHPADPRLLGAIRNFSDESWQALMRVERLGRGAPKRHVGPIASGDKVIAFGEVLTHYQSPWPELIGVEMEAAGVATASFQAAKPPGFFMVRAVADFADEAKGSNRVEKWRSYACDAAASFVIALLKSGPVPLAVSGPVREQPSGPTSSQLPLESRESANTPLTSSKREPQIVNPKKLSLPPHAATLLKKMFADYWRVVIEQEFGSGFSGGRVFLVRPIRTEDRPELPAVVKIASVSLIKKEQQAYQYFIQDRLPNAIGMRDKPIFLPVSDWAGLRYPLVGSGAFAFQSLRDYCQTASLEDIRFVLEERLLKVIESLLQFNRVSPAFSLEASYDPLLPLNLLVQPRALPAEAKPMLLTPEALPHVPLKQGDYVRLEGFVVTKVDLVDGTVSLNVSTSPDGPPASYSLRLKSIGGLASYQADQIIEPVEGVVLETRQERLEAETRRALGAGFNPASEALTLPDGTQLPNPLLKLHAILSQFPNVRVGTIHGDLNLENILVDPAIREINLIDFAAAREDHVLHDFLRLETEIVTKLIPELLTKANLGAGVIRPFYEQLHQFMLNPAQPTPPLPHPTLVKPFTMLAVIRKAARPYFFKWDDWTEYYQGLVLYLLGALKFASLDQMVEVPAPLPKQVAFWAAAVIGSCLLMNR